MKGGSVASSAVEGLVQGTTWTKLDAQFDNQVGGKKKKQAKKTTSKSKKTTTKPKQPKQKGGICPVCVGGKMKHMNDFESEGLFNLYNKKGGASPSFPIKYDYSDAMMKPLHGDVINRGLNTDIMSVMASDSPSSLGSMNKTIAFGGVVDTPKVPFVYTGGSKKKTTKTTKPKTTKTSKPKASKAKPKKK
jgi:hypothetical protein